MVVRSNKLVKNRWWHDSCSYYCECVQDVFHFQCFYRYPSLGFFSLLTHTRLNSRAIHHKSGAITLDSGEKSREGSRFFLHSPVVRYLAAKSGKREGRNRFEKGEVDSYSIPFLLLVIEYSTQIFSQEFSLVVLSSSHIFCTIPCHESPRSSCRCACLQKREGRWTVHAGNRHDMHILFPISPMTICIALK